MSTYYGITVTERTRPAIDDETLTMLEKVVADACTAVPAEPGDDPEQVARQALNAGADAVRTWAAAHLPVYADDLATMAHTTGVSRAAVTTSPAYETPGLVSDRFVDMLRTWAVCGDWAERPRTAAEIVVELAEDGDFDPRRNIADARLLEKARAEHTEGAF